MANMTEIYRGDEANKLLENDIYIESMQKVRDGIVKAMQDAPMGDEKTHNRLVIALQLLNQIEKQIKDIATTGKMAKLQFEQQSTMRERFRNVSGF